MSVQDSSEKTALHLLSNIQTQHTDSAAQYSGLIACMHPRLQKLDSWCGVYYYAVCMYIHVTCKGVEQSLDPQNFNSVHSVLACVTVLFTATAFFDRQIVVLEVRGTHIFEIFHLCVIGSNTFRTLSPYPSGGSMVPLYTYNTET